MPDKPNGLLKRAAFMFDLPENVIPGIARIEICGNDEILIENHKGILEYDDTRLSVNVGKHLLQIEGENLALSAMNDFGLRLYGNIVSVIFKPI